MKALGDLPKDTNVLTVKVRIPKKILVSKDNAPIEGYLVFASNFGGDWFITRRRPGKWTRRLYLIDISRCNPMKDIKVIS